MRKIDLMVLSYVWECPECTRKLGDDIFIEIVYCPYCNLSFEIGRILHSGAYNILREDWRDLIGLFKEIREKYESGENPNLDDYRENKMKITRDEYDKMVKGHDPYHNK